MPKIKFEIDTQKDYLQLERQIHDTVKILLTIVNDNWVQESQKIIRRYKELHESPNEFEPINGC